ncbi:MAG: AMP-binding protein [Flavobacteriaceae bacterium]|nr:AMP-binding protein [Flavobacteriaceae bacterium]
MTSISYVSGPSSIPLLGETIGQNLKRTVENYPDNITLVSLHQNYKVTYKEFWQQTTQLAKSLLALGIQSGDRVGIWSPNRFEWTLLQYATARIGVILVNINPAYRSNELIYVLNQSGIKFLISALHFKTSDYKKIVNPDTGEIVERGLPGELCTRGYSVMLKYWENPEATHYVLDDAGWMHSGDLTVMDEEGYINIAGRIKDVIIRGGENISPREIEEFLYTHDLIEDVQVIGVPSEKFGEEIMAWVKLKTNVELSQEELLQFCKDQITHYKVPKFWKFVDSFPMTITGKIKKVEMREISIKELGLEDLLKIKTS